MGFIKKLFYKTVETTELEKNEDQDADKEPNPFLVDFPEDTDESQNESNPFLQDSTETMHVDEPNPFLEELNEKSKSVEIPEGADKIISQEDLSSVDSIVSEVLFDLPAGEFDDDENRINIDKVLMAGGIDRNWELDSGEYSVEKVMQLIEEGVPKESLPPVIKVSGKSVEDVIQDALQKGAICEEFEENYQQEHHAQVQQTEDDMKQIEQETNQEIDQLKAEMEMRIQDLEENRQNGLNELRVRKQALVHKFNQDIAILDDYEAKCAKVAEFLRQPEPNESEQSIM